MIQPDLTRLLVGRNAAQSRKASSRGLFLSIVAAALLFNSAGADAATITVTSGGDNGPGTLRQAISDAVPGDTINFAPGITTISLASAELSINKSLTISGPGANLLTVQRVQFAPAFRIFNIASGNFTVTLSGLTITKGATSPDGADGGGVRVNAGATVAITSCAVSANFTSQASGAGIFNGGTMTITNSTISGNTTSFERGPGLDNTGTLTISGSTFSGNSAPQGPAGGCIYVSGGMVTITNSTVFRNTAGAGIYNANGTLTAKNSIIAVNSDINGHVLDVHGAITSQGYNFIGSNAETIITPATGDQIGTAASPIDPALGPLQNNRGPTLTHAPVNGSPVIDQGGGSGMITDQRGLARPVRYNTSIPEPSGGDGSDIGAVELSTVQFDAPNYSVAENGGSVTVSVSRAGDVSQPASVHYATADGKATAGSDYSSAAGDLAFAPDERSKTISIQVLDDTTYEGDETFYVMLSSPMGADPGLMGTVVTIVENDPGPPSPTPTPTPPLPKLLNISTRAQVQGGDKVMIAGFIVTGNASKKVIIRALGPSLKKSGLSDVVTDPVLELHGSSGSLIASNDNWKDNPDQALLIQASGVPPQDDLESAIVATLPPATYTAVMSDKSSGSGLGLVEVYDLDQNSDSELANISTRATVGTADRVLIGGFILGGGNGNPTIVVRALGPSLAQIGISNTLADPILELRDGNGALIAFDDNWKDNPSQASQLIQTGLQPQSDSEAAIAAQLPPGGYTAVVFGKNGGIGVGLVEVYNLQ